MDKPRFIIAVSGGVDSCFLLHHLMEQEVDAVVCHVNHGLRSESGEEAKFVRGLAQEYGLPYEEKILDLSAQGSFEAEARHERLQFFAEVCQQYGVKEVALGHHADDQAETLLMQLCRGAKGLQGMREHTRLDDYGITVWRPLLSWRKATIRDWMEARNFSWREDVTNGQPIAVRNRVRNEVMPLLSEVFSRDVVPVVTRAQPDDLTAQLEELLQLVDLKDPQGRLFLPKLSLLSEPLQSRVFFDYLKEEGIQELSTEKLQECLQLINAVDIAKVNLPGGHYLRRKEQRVFIQKA